MSRLEELKQKWCQKEFSTIVRGLIKKVFRAKKREKFAAKKREKFASSTQPSSWHRSGDLENPLVTGKTRPPAHLSAQYKTRTGQILASAAITLLAGIGETIRLDEKLKADTVVLSHNSDCPLLSTSQLDPIKDYSEWIRVVRQGVKCMTDNDRVRNRIRRTYTPISTSEVCNSRPGNDRFGRFYTQRDIRYWRTAGDRKVSFNSWHEVDRTLNPASLLASTLANNGQLSISHTWPSLRIGTVQRRSAFGMGIGLKFDVRSLLNMGPGHDHEILYWHIHILLTEAKSRHGLQDAVQRIFGLAPYCKIMYIEHNERGNCDNESFLNSDRNGLVSDLDHLNYQDRVRISTTLRSMITGSNDEIVRCSNGNETDCTNLAARNNATAIDALHTYAEILNVWYSHGSR